MKASVGVLLAAFLLLGAAPATAQYSAIIRGVVEDDEGRPMPGAVVTVTHHATRTVRVAITDLRGEYRVSGLQPETPYRVQVFHPRFRKHTLEARAYASVMHVNRVQLIERDRDAARR